MPGSIEKTNNLAGLARRRVVIDPLSKPVYAVLGFALGAEVAILAASNFYLGTPSLPLNLAQLIALAIAAAFVRGLGFERAALFIEAICILPIAGALAVTATVFMAAISGPFADPWLAAADRALGFDFKALVQFYGQHPWIATLSRYAYMSFAIQASLVPVLLALAGRGRRMWILFNAWVLSLLVAVLVFPLVPAAGPFAYHGIAQDVFEQWKRLFPWETGPAIAALRDGSMRDVTAAARGFISLPSFHAAGGAMFIWACWDLRWLRWPMLALNLALIASTIVTGAHYLIDIIAGLALAAAALHMSVRWSSQRSAA